MIFDSVLEPEYSLPGILIFQVIDVVVSEFLSQNSPSWVRTV